MKASERVNLEKIVTATTGSEGFTYMTPLQFKNLEAEGYVESNPEMTNGLNGLAKKIAVRATEKGIGEIFGGIKAEFVNPTESNEAPVNSETKNENTIMSNEEQKAPEVVASKFEIITETAVPTVERRVVAERESKYPFDQLNPVPEPGNGFFVPATESMPEPWKSLQSSLTNANKKYAVVTGNKRINRKGNEVEETVQTRQFVMRRVTEPAVGVKIVRVK